MVIRFAACSDVLPAPFLLLKIETGSVWEEEESQQHPTETEPRHDVKFHRGGDVVIQDGGSQCAEFATCGGKTVGGGTDWSRVDFGGDKEGNGVGAELVEE